MAEEVVEVTTKMNEGNESEVETFNVGVTDEFITQERVIAVVRAACILVSTVATLFGYSVDADLWFNAIMTVAMVASIGWGYWMNNNWTELANLAQSLLLKLKSNKDM